MCARAGDEAVRDVEPSVRDDQRGAAAGAAVAGQSLNVMMMNMLL